MGLERTCQPASKSDSMLPVLPLQKYLLKEDLERTKKRISTRHLTKRRTRVHEGLVSDEIHQAWLWSNVQLREQGLVEKRPGFNLALSCCGGGSMVFVMVRESDNGLPMTSCYATEDTCTPQKQRNEDQSITLVTFVQVLGTDKAFWQKLNCGVQLSFRNGFFRFSLHFRCKS